MDSEVISDIVGTIWEAVLGSSIEQAAECALDSTTVTGYVSISGQWAGRLSATCSEALARRIAMAMFMQDDSVSESEVCDAFGEVINMMGGNFKALLPPPCHLSLPIVQRGSPDRTTPPDDGVLARSFFVAEGEPLVVCVHGEGTSNEKSNI